MVLGVVDYIGKAWQLSMFGIYYVHSKTYPRNNQTNCVLNETLHEGYNKKDPISYTPTSNLKTHCRQNCEAMRDFFLLKNKQTMALN